jgi:hypothetical protein
MPTNVCFIGDFWQKFDLKNVISTYTKDFFRGKNGLDSPNFKKKINSNR